MFNSKLTPEAVANCIAVAIDNSVAGWKPDIRHIGDTYTTQLVTEIHGVLFLADAVPSPGGSTVTVYDQWFLGRDKVRTGMESCR